MKNNTHLGETKEMRLKRFQENPPVEIIETLLNSIANYFNNEIRVTTEKNNYQTSLLFLGIHAVALTISEAFFNKTGPVGYKLFIEKFVDGDIPGTKFSDIADVIHNWRNIIAHQWLGNNGYKIGYDYKMTRGWEKRNGIIFINPEIYHDYYLNAFESGGRIWDYKNLFNEIELAEIKERLLKNF